MNVLAYGANGWIGGIFMDELKCEGHRAICSKLRVNTGSMEQVRSELDFVKPSHVVCFIGKARSAQCKTVDALEQPGMLPVSLESNCFAPVALALACMERNIHMTYFGTGCIFTSEYDPETGAPLTKFNEHSEQNFFGSTYSTLKGVTNALMNQPFLSKSVLNVILRMPISGVDGPFDFVSKIRSYSKVVNIQNSMTVLPTLLPLLSRMMVDKRTGPICLTNPGTISHHEILTAYRDICDPEFKWETFAEKDQNAILKSERSNNMLDTSRLESLFPYVVPIKEAVHQVMAGYKPSVSSGELER